MLSFNADNISVMGFLHSFGQRQGGRRLYGIIPWSSSSGEKNCPLLTGWLASIHGLFIGIPEESVPEKNHKLVTILNV